MEKILEKIIILDCGSQTTQLIARRVREEGVYCEIYPFNYPINKISEDPNVKGIIISGGPASIYDDKSPNISKEIFDINLPILGICYGLQLICNNLGGCVKKSNKREFGLTGIKLDTTSNLFKDINDNIDIWMNHSDIVTSIPEGFYSIASTNNTPFAAISNNKNVYAVQFHPEVSHTVQGSKMISNFVKNICHCSNNWNMENFIENKIKEIKKTVGASNVICGISGGVDSSVIATLIHKAIRNQLKCVFVNNGLLRKKEINEVLDLLENKVGLEIKYVDAEEEFLKALENISDPEQKRKIIGKVFIDVFNREAKTIENADFLAQGTLYPDIIESTSVNGPSSVIKSHHNVGGLPSDLKFKLLEPARELFKDEVRKLGKELGLTDEVIQRHPFPGPGLAVRILGEITKDKLQILRKADSIVVEEIKKLGIYNDVWQAFAVLLPVKTVGIMGDERSYDYVIAIRIVQSTDGMTANTYNIDNNALFAISNRITNEVKGVNRVVYDVSSKPPSTIEWE